MIDNNGYRGSGYSLRKLRYIFALLCCALLSISELSAQYYSWGADPASLKWRDIKTADVRLIYPDTVDAVARRTLLYIESIKGDVNFGFKYPALEVPFVMHADNFSSNGMVMWMPKRVEFLTTPATDSYSMLWTKQLVAHEYRHAVQYNNLNRGFVKGLSYILGEQGSAVGFLLLPLAIIEGDAVKCETSMSTFGRALQPSFTIEYRAIGDEILNGKNVDKWFCGSYIDKVPDHYHLGYQIVDYAYTRYKENVWNKVVEYSVRNPYVLATTSTSLKKYYDTNMAKLVRATFDDLIHYWNSIPQQSNTTEIISNIDTTNYTTYKYPTVYNRHSIVAIKSDYKDTQRIVAVDIDSGDEQALAHTGVVSTRPTVGGGRMWWSEYRQSNLFKQRVNSVLCYMDVETGVKHSVSGVDNTLYPTAIGGSESHLAYVEYAPSGVYTIVEMRVKAESVRRKSDFVEVSRTSIPQPTEIHGLAWDDESDELYFIATDNSGMWIGVRDLSCEEGYRQLRQGAYITISDLRAKGGVLYFGSIESGYDELHTYDLSTGIESRVSRSQFGSFNPSTPNGGEIYATTYDKYGYHLARQSLDSLSVEVRESVVPQNIVNPKRLKWDLINLDNVVYSSADSLASYENHHSKRYRKWLNLINIHSWMPASYNPFNLSSESQLNMSYGATLVSQNLLSSMESYISYGYNRSEGSVVKGSLEYDGLGVSLGIGATYGGDQVLYPTVGGQVPSGKKHYSITAGFTLPLVFDGGYHMRTLSVSSYWNFSNGSILDIDNMRVNPQTGEITNYDELRYRDGLHKLSFGVGYSDFVRSAHRDIATPFGYSLSASYAIAPSCSHFSDLVSLYGKIITRGVLPYNMFSIAGSYQTSIGGYELNGNKLLQFQSVALLPQGYSSSDVMNRNYLATSMNYQFPILYPEGGIGSMLYVKRVRLNLGYGVAQFEYNSGDHEVISSYGGGLIFDINALRLPEASTTALKLSIYRLKSGVMSYQFGIDLPI